MNLRNYHPNQWRTAAHSRERSRQVADNSGFQIREEGRTRTQRTDEVTQRTNPAGPRPTTVEQNERRPRQRSYCSGSNSGHSATSRTSKTYTVNHRHGRVTGNIRPQRDFRAYTTSQTNRSQSQKSEYYLRNQGQIRVLPNPSDGFEHDLRDPAHQCVPAGMMHTAMLASKKSSRRDSKKSRSHSRTSREQTHSQRTRRTSAKKNAPSAEQSERRGRPRGSREAPSGREERSALREDGAHPDLEHQINMSQILSSQVSQPSQLSYISRNGSQQKMPRPEDYSKNYSSMPEEESFGHPGSFQNSTEPFRSNPNDSSMRGAFREAPNNNDLPGGELGPHSPNYSNPQAREAHGLSAGEHLDQRRESNFPPYEAFKSHDYRRQVHGYEPYSAQPLLVSNKASGETLCTGDGKQRTETIVSSQRNDRASDLSGKSNHTDGSRGVFSQHMLRSFKQKEYGNLKPVLVEAAERQKSSVGSASRAGRSPAASSGHKAGIVSGRGKNSAAQLRSLDANNSKPQLRFQTIGSQNASSNSKGRARQGLSSGLDTLAQSAGQETAEQTEYLKEPDFIHQRKHLAQQAAPQRNPHHQALPPTGSSKASENTMSYKDNWTEPAPQAFEQTNRNATPLPLSPQETPQMRMANTQVQLSLEHSGVKSHPSSRRAPVAGESFSNSNGTSKQQSVATLNPQMPSPHFPGQGSKLNIQSSSRGELAARNPPQEQDQLDAVERQFEEYQKKIAALELKKHLEAQQRALPCPGPFSAQSQDQPISLTDQMEDEGPHDLQDDPGAPEHAAARSQFSPPSIQYGDSLNTVGDNGRAPSTATNDGTPHCRQRPPRPQQMPCIEQSNEFSQYHESRPTHGSPSPDGACETSPSYLQHEAYHQYVTSLRKETSAGQNHVQVLDQSSGREILNELDSLHDREVPVNHGQYHEAHEREAPCSGHRRLPRSQSRSQCHLHHPDQDMQMEAAIRRPSCERVHTHGCLAARPCCCVHTRPMMRPQCPEYRCGCDRASWRSSRSYSRVNSYERSLAANTPQQPVQDHRPDQSQLGSFSQPMGFRQQAHPMRVPSMEQNFIIKGQNQDLFSHHDTHESYMNSTANLGPALSGDRHYPIQQLHAMAGRSTDSFEGPEAEQHHCGFYDQDNHTIPSEQVARLQNEVSVRNLAHNYSDKSVQRVSTNQSQRPLAHNYSIAEEAVGFFNQSAYDQRAVRIDRATNTTKLNLNTPRRQRKKRCEPGMRHSSIKKVRNTSKSRSRSRSRHGKQCRSASAPKKHAKMYNDLNHRQYTIKKGRIVRKTNSPRDRTGNTCHKYGRMRSAKPRSQSPKLRRHHQSAEPFKPLYSVRDIMVHLGLQNLAHLFTDKGLTQASQLCLLDDRRLKQMLMPPHARRAILEYMRKFERHIRAIARARMFQSWEQQRTRGPDRSFTFAGRGPQFQVYRPSRARPIRQPPMRFKTVGRGQTAQRGNRKPNVFQELEKSMKNKNYLLQPSIFAHTLSNESTIRTRGNCINVQVRSMKQSQKDTEASPPRRRSRKERARRSGRPHTGTINSRSAISNLSKSMKSRQKRNSTHTRNSILVDKRSSSVVPKSSKKRLSKSRSRNEDRRLTTQSQIEECENIKIVDNQFNSRNASKSCISEKSKPSSCLSQTAPMSGLAMRMSAKSPSQGQKAGSRDFRRQNTSQSDALGTRRTHAQKRGSSRKDIAHSKSGRRNAIQSNPILTRETSFKAPINIEVGGKINKDSSNPGLKKILNLKQRKGARRTSKQKRVVALLQELELLLDDDTQETMQLSSSDTQTVALVHANGAVTARGNCSNGSSMHPGQLLSELSRVNKQPTVYNNDIEGVMPEKSVGYPSQVQTYDQRSSFNNSMEQDPQIKSARGAQVLCVREIVNEPSTWEARKDLAEASKVDKYAKEEAESKPNLSPTPRHGAAGPLRFAQGSCKNAMTMPKTHSQVRIQENDSKISKITDKLRHINTTSEVSETQSRQFEHHIRRDSKKMTLQSSTQTFEQPRPGPGPSRDPPKAATRVPTHESARGVEKPYYEASSHREHKKLTPHDPRNLVSFDNLNEYEQVASPSRGEQESGSRTQRQTKPDEKRKKKKKAADLAQPEQYRDTRRGSPSHSSSCAQFVQAPAPDTTKYTDGTGPQPSQETAAKHGNAQRPGHAQIELLEKGGGRNAPTFLSDVTSPTYRSVNYWNTEQAGLAEVNTILQDLEHEQFARGNVDASQYKRVLQNLLSNYHRRHFSGGSLGADATFLQIDEALHKLHAGPPEEPPDPQRKNSTVCLAGGQITIQDIRQEERTQSRLGGQSEAGNSNHYNSLQQATSPDFKRQHTTETEAGRGPSAVQISRNQRSRQNVLNQLTSRHTSDSAEKERLAREEADMPEEPAGGGFDHQEVGPDAAGPYSYASGPYQDQTMLSLKQDQMDMFRPNPSLYSSDLSSFDHFSRAAQRPMEPVPPAHGLSNNSTALYSTAPYEPPHVYAGPTSLHSQDQQDSYMMPDKFLQPDQCMGSSMHLDPCGQRHPVYSLSTEADVHRLPLQVLSQSFNLNQTNIQTGAGQGVGQSGMSQGLSQRSGALGMSQGGFNSGVGLNLVSQGSVNQDLQRLHVPARSPYSSKPLARPYGPSGSTPVSLKKPSTRHSKYSSQAGAPLPHKSLELSHKRPSAASAFTPGVQPDVIRMQCDRNKQIYERACTEIMNFHDKIRDIERRMAHLGATERPPVTPEQQYYQYGGGPPPQQMVPPQQHAYDRY